MSYVDLMGNARWSEADHVRRTEALHRTHWPAEEEAILNRDVSGVTLGLVAMTPQLQERMVSFKASAEAARAAGALGRADAALLHAALDIEEAEAAWTAVPAAPQDPEAEDAHAQERAARLAALEALLASASPEVLALVAARQPAIEPAPQEPAP